MENLVQTNGADERNPVGFIPGMLLGGLAVFGIILLLVTRSGPMMRAQIKKRSIQLHDRTTDTLHDLYKLAHFDYRKIRVRTREETERLQNA
jgi:hypothetical protein